VPLDESWHDCNKLLIELVRNLTDINFLNSSNRDWGMNQRNVVALLEYLGSYIYFLTFLGIGYLTF
jgi:hypothetical protein